MKHLRIGIDVDGILADFNTPFRELVKAQTGISLPEISSNYPDTWYYHKVGGVTNEQDKLLWKTIANDPCFWENVPEYPDAIGFLERLKLDFYHDDIYFITSRSGDNAKKQTENWLEDLWFNGPTVLISSNKGYCCKALKLTHYLDDRNENCQDVRDTSIDTNGYMLDRPWNEKQYDVPVLFKINEFLNILEGEKKNG